MVVVVGVVCDDCGCWWWLLVLLWLVYTGVCKWWLCVLVIVDGGG